MTDVLSSQVVVGTTATKLVSAAAAGQQVILTNQEAEGSGKSVFVGSATVTTSTGVEVKGGRQLAQGPFELPPETALYAVCATGTVRVDVFAVVGD